MAAEPHNHSIHLAVEAIVTSVNELENTITYDLTIIAEWNEPSLQQHDSSSSHKYRSVEDESIIPWKCEFIFFHEKESVISECTYYLDRTTGSVCVIKNWNLTISQLLDLHAFPCDRQMLKIKFIVLDVEHVYPYAESVGRPSVLDDLVGRAGLKAGMQVSSWHLHACDLRVTESGDADEPECEATFDIFVQRNSFFYCVNFGTVLFLILLCALSVAAIDFNSFSDRMGVTLNLLLTMVAFKFVMTSYVPPTSYLTLLDKYMLLTIGMLSSIVFENWIACLSKWEANDVLRFEQFFYRSMAFFWITLHLVLCIGISFSLFTPSYEQVKHDAKHELKKIAGTYETTKTPPLSQKHIQQSKKDK